MNTSGPTEQEIIEGGTLISVRYRNGQTEQMKVRILPLRELPRLAACLQNEAEMAEIYCDQPAHWADALTADSVFAIVDAGERLNADFFGRYLDRLLRRQAALVPGVAAGSSMSSPTSPSPAAGGSKS